MSQLVEAGDERMALAPVINWHNDSDRACHLVKVCTWDRPGLFSNLTGAFAAAGLNILSARIFTRADTIAFDAFFVTDAATGALATRETRDRLESLINRVLKGDDLGLQALISRQKPARPIYQAHENEHIETSLHFDNEISENRTALEIETEDRVGLLHVIALALAALRVDISAAKIFTEKGAALDTFYIREIGGAKILDGGRQAEIERAVRAGIKSLDRA
jgi:[protein-PII] uridylyltransferase